MYMIIKITTCPKCLKKTLIVTFTDSSVSKKCTYEKCDFKEIMLVKDYKEQLKKSKV